MKRPLEKTSVVVLLLVGIAYAILPEQVGQLLAPGVAALTDGLTWANTNLPRPVFLVLVFLATATVSILIALSFARVFYRLLSNAGPRVTFVYQKLTPSTPIGKIAVAFGVMVAFLVGSVWALPYVIGDLSESSTFNNTSQIGSKPPADILDEVEREALGILSADVVTTTGGDSYSGPPYQRPTPDADGDRLKDSWERRGQTPAGVQLPDADPQRMDLYVQVNYGGGSIPLSDAEKRQLREVWAAMPVDNPDGSQGITLHIDDQRPRGGGLGQQVVYSGSESHEDVDRFYTSQYLGERLCRYHQIVVADVQNRRVGGMGSSPGYASYVQNERNEVYTDKLEQYDFDREVSPRVHTITHELLHNVVGSVNGSPHTQEGWLAPTADPRETFLSSPTASELNSNGLAGSGYYQQERCGHGGGTTTDGG